MLIVDTSSSVSVYVPEALQVTPVSQAGESVTQQDGRREVPPVPKLLPQVFCVPASLLEWPTGWLGSQDNRLTCGNAPSGSKELSCSTGGRTGQGSDLDYLGPAHWGTVITTPVRAFRTVEMSTISLFQVKLKRQLFSRSISLLSANCEVANTPGRHVSVIGAKA